MFRVDRHSNVALKFQVLEQFRHLLHFGNLREGQRLPSVRRLARQLGSNPKTAYSIYHFLEFHGLVRIRPQSGVYVAAKHPNNSQMTRAFLASRIRRLITEAQGLGIAESELKRMVGAWVEGTSTSSCLFVECNREQLDVLSVEIRQALQIEVWPLLLQDLAKASLSDLERVSLILTTDYHFQEVLPMARSAGKDVFRIWLDPEFFESLGGELKKGRLLFVTGDPGFKEVFMPALGKFFARRQVKNLTVLPSHRRAEIKALLPKIRTLYISPSCSATARQSILMDKPAGVSFLEISHFVSPESLNPIRDFLLLAG